MSWLLEGRGLEILYKPQVRSSLEYACLAWGSAANKHLALLDKVQARAVRIIEDNNARQEPHLTTLQHRRDVAGLTVVFKVQVKRVSHLQALWQPYRLALVTTHAVALAPGRRIDRAQRLIMDKVGPHTPNTSLLLARDKIAPSYGGGGGAHVMVVGYGGGVVCVCGGGVQVNGHHIYPDLRALIPRPLRVGGHID
ncbi:hypothetical protein GWK47_024081 [Chionoecetes opilio]|uniref:Uncharacterized protein n=1 Tax=Chionoecetes opilio TaxID=41210 RepID=A0A8J4XLA6_CHIOP|nr:hypothetical protein GWK47_024081 [Chionoecetes opilio]